MCIRLSWLIAGIAVLSLFGCKGNLPDTKNPKGSDASQGKTTDPGQNAKTPTETPKLKASDIPAELKHEAFKYLPMDKAAPATYTVTLSDGTSLEGTEEQKITKVDATGATLETVRSGSLGTLGNEVTLLTKDGVYQVEVQGEKLSKPSLILPADVKPGSKWQSTFELKTPKGMTTMDWSFNAEKMEQVKVKAGKYDALLVTATATTEIAGQKMKGASRTWFAKGIGVVKSTYYGNDQNKKKIQYAVELVKE